MAAIPFVKLAALLIKSVAKPITKQFIEEAKTRENFRTVCHWTGQFSHQVVSRLNILGAGYKFLNVKPLEAADAVVKGAEILSEGILLSVAGFLAVFEYIRSKKKETLEKLRLADERLADNAYFNEQIGLLQEKLISAEKRITQLEEAKTWNKIAKIFSSDSSRKEVPQSAVPDVNLAAIVPNGVPSAIDKAPIDNPSQLPKSTVPVAAEGSSAALAPVTKEIPVIDPAAVQIPLPVIETPIEVKPEVSWWDWLIKG